MRGAYAARSFAREAKPASATARRGVAEQLESGKPLVVVMGSSIDALKLVSSLTLFAHVARQLDAAGGLDAHRHLATTAEKVLAIADQQGYPQCRFTLDRLRASGSDTSPPR